MENQFASMPRITQRMHKQNTLCGTKLLDRSRKTLTLHNPIAEVNECTKKSLRATALLKNLKSWCVWTDQADCSGSSPLLEHGPHQAHASWPWGGQPGAPNHAWRQLQHLLIGLLCQGFAGILARTFWLLRVTCIWLISSMGEDTVSPLTINEEIAHFIEDLTVRLQRARLQKKDFWILILLGIRLKLLCSWTQKIGCFPIELWSLPRTPCVHQCGAGPGNVFEIAAVRDQLHQHSRCQHICLCVWLLT